MGHNWNKYKLEWDKFPWCGKSDKTFTHLLTCKHDGIKAIRRETYLREYQELEIPLNSSHIPLQVIHIDLEDDNGPTLFKHEIAQSIFESQKQIGFCNTDVGLMSNERTAMLKLYEVDYPQAKMAQILAMPCYHICEPISVARNETRHSKSNYIS